MQKVNVAEKLALFTDYWHPRIVGELNGQHIKLVKLKGEFVWHHHEHEDEQFPSMAQARAWYASPEYAEALTLRAQALDRRLIFVDGVTAT